MGYEPDFGALVKEIVASLGGDFPEVAEQAGIHKTTLYQWAKGHTPGKPGTLLKAANGWKLTGDTRTQLFSRAGFVEPKATEPRAVGGSQEVIRQTAEETARRTVTEMLDKIGFGQRGSPRDYYERQLGRRIALYSEAGLTLPASPPRYQGGRDSIESEEDADSRLELWDDLIRSLNPGKELPPVG